MKSSQLHAWLLLIIATFTGGWNWDYTNAPAGNSLLWKTCTGHFSSAAENELLLAADGWSAGAGEDMRGADWHFYWGGYEPSSSCGLNDGENEIYTRNAAWMTSRGYGNALAVCFCKQALYNDYDIVFNTAWNWVTVPPSSTDLTQVEFSIGQVALHELGHALGLDHANQVIATMNSKYPNGGDISAYRYRPNEDDYAGLAANRPDSSTGKNLMLSRFDVDPTDVGDSLELWDFKDLNWTVCDGIVSSPGGPEQIYAIIEGTACKSPIIEWWLSADTTCMRSSPPDYLVGTRQPTLCANTPYLVHPNPYDFSGVPPGDYYLCAFIDPDDLIAESHSGDLDNNLQSEVTVTVQDCP